MQDSKVHPGLRIVTRRLKKDGTKGMLIHAKHLSVRRRDVTGTIIQAVAGHGGDVWFVQHDESDQVGAYAFTEMEPLPLWHDEMTKAGLNAGILDRLKFHNGLQMKQIVEHTGVSARTIKKHANRLVEQGLATWSRQPAQIEDWILYRV
jgi:hypothetical protein